MQSKTLGSKLTKIQLVNYVLCATPKKLKIVVLGILFSTLKSIMLVGCFCFDLRVGWRRCVVFVCVCVRERARVETRLSFEQLKCSIRGGSDTHLANYFCLFGC
jgi:hypothetical protein